MDARTGSRRRSGTAGAHCTIAPTGPQDRGKSIRMSDCKCAGIARTRIVALCDDSRRSKNAALPYDNDCDQITIGEMWPGPLWHFAACESSAEVHRELSKPTMPADARQFLSSPCVFHFNGLVAGEKQPRGGEAIQWRGKEWAVATAALSGESPHRDPKLWAKQLKRQPACHKSKVRSSVVLAFPPLV